MSEDGFGFRLPFLSFNFSKKDAKIKLNEGETILLRYWSWRKFGYRRKAYTLRHGRVNVQVLS